VRGSDVDQRLCLASLGGYQTSPAPLFVKQVMQAIIQRLGKAQQRKPRRHWHGDFFQGSQTHTGMKTHV
jgi:hypothetical protein